MNKKWRVWALATAVFLVPGGCACSVARGTNDIAVTKAALRDTDRGRMELMEHGTETEKAAIERFKSFYRVFSAQRINESLSEVYAEGAYFEDGIRQVRGRQSIREYILGTTSAFEECTFDIVDVATSRDDYYFRWTMTLRLRRDPDTPLVLPGMSHVRFDRQGMVVFHHDYWETLALFERFPVIGGVLRWIKSRI